MTKKLSNGILLHINNDQELFLKCHKDYDRELRRALAKVKRLAQADVAYSHVRTGNLLRSIRVGEINTLRGSHRIAGTVVMGGPKAPYAAHVHNGTDRHDIPPAEGGYLAFEWKGRTGRVATRVWERSLRESSTSRFRPGHKGRWRIKTRWRQGALDSKEVVIPWPREVNHPGYEGDPFLRRAMEEVAASYKGWAPKRRRR